jgi:hypothetical protein
MQELTFDFIASLEGRASAEGWPGWWGLHPLSTVIAVRAAL